MSSLSDALSFRRFLIVATGCLVATTSCVVGTQSGQERAVAEEENDDNEEEEKDNPTTQHTHGHPGSNNLPGERDDAASNLFAQECPCSALGSYCQFAGSSCPFPGVCHGTSTKCDCDSCGITPSGVDPECKSCVHAPSPAVAPWVGPYPFELWYDVPGSAAYAKREPKWYDGLVTRAGENFTTTRRSDGQSARVHVDMGQHGAIHLFADPEFQQGFDEKVRQLNGKAEAQLRTGIGDRCGWPNVTASEAPDHLQHVKRTKVFYDDFSRGLRNDSWNIALTKGCCDKDPVDVENPFRRNINILRDNVHGKEKNVLALTAWNEDDTSTCPGDNCTKIVHSSGTVSTANLFASGRYEVIAKVADAPGLVWALWTFHYEEHLPSDCATEHCWCVGMPDTPTMVHDQCELHADNSSKELQACKFADLCNNNTDGWDPSDAPPAPVMTPAQCGANHTEDDPQFLANHSIGGWTTIINHEIDIEIPANCVGQLSVCNVTEAGVPGTCVGQYNTANLNNYQFTQNSGTGPAYSNMCVRAVKESDGGSHSGTPEVPVKFIGDGKYHNYTIVWHTGGKKIDTPGSPQTSRLEGFVDFYIDGFYLGTNNAFVPTRGSRLFLAHWAPHNKNHLWNGIPNNWGGGFAGDNKTHNVTTMISEVKITPFNEPRDIMYPQTNDLPDGCIPDYTQKYPSSPDVCHSVWTYPPDGLAL